MIQGKPGLRADFSLLTKQPAQKEFRSGDVGGLNTRLPVTLLRALTQLYFLFGEGVLVPALPYLPAIPLQSFLESVLYVLAR